MKTFLKVPQKVDLALVLVMSLAKRPAGQTASLDEVAREGAVSQGYLEEVARLLRAAGLVEGRRGAHGGYVLSRDSRDITVADIITAIEGRTWSAECLGEEDRPKVSANNDIWRKVQGQVMTTLHGMTIADLAAEKILDSGSRPGMTKAV